MIRNEWFINQRLLFIERCLAVNGRVNRADLVTAFGISGRQASSDFGAYIAVAPGNMRYEIDGGQGAYVRTEGFRAALGTEGGNA